MASRKRLALIFGGRSGEHAVSIVSARSVSQAIDANRYEVIPMAIDRTGLWADSRTAAAVLDDSEDRADKVVDFRGTHRIDPRLLEEQFDVAFPVLHGPFGEDGSMQGLLEMLDLAYVGCDVTASAVCMDKILCKRLLEQGGFATAPWVDFERRRWSREREIVARDCLELGLPLFVKPNRLGSSVGITKVNQPDDLRPAIELALEHDRRALVETAISGREIEVPILGNDDPRPAIPGEIIPGHEFYDYDDKYIDDSCQLLAPAPLEQDDVERAQSIAVEVYRLLGCTGMARIDLFLEPEKTWVNEVNTIPGFTSISMYPKLWSISGLSYSQLIDELIELAIARHQQFDKP